MIVIAAATIAAALASGTTTEFAPVSYMVFGNGAFKYHVVTADLRSSEISAATVHSPSLTSAWKLLNLLPKSKVRPVAAITGTFFAPASSRPVADVLVDGKLVAKGSRGTAVGVDWFGGVNIFDKPFQQKVDWGLYQYGLRGAVRVVSKGIVQPNPKAQKFRDSRIWGKAARTGVGTTPSGKLVLIATTQHVTLTDLGNAMKARGVTEGVSLDGGSSTCLYYQGSMVVTPGRSLSNLFVITQTRATE